MFRIERLMIGDVSGRDFKYHTLCFLFQCFMSLFFVIFHVLRVMCQEEDQQTIRYAL